MNGGPDLGGFGGVYQRCHSVSFTILVDTYPYSIHIVDTQIYVEYVCAICNSDMLENLGA